MHKFISFTQTPIGGKPERVQLNLAHVARISFDAASIALTILLAVPDSQSGAVTMHLKGEEAKAALSAFNAA